MKAFSDNYEKLQKEKKEFVIDEMTGFVWLLRSRSSGAECTGEARRSAILPVCATLCSCCACACVSSLDGAGSSIVA